MTGVAVGLIGGTILGFVAEVISGGGKLVMTLDAFAGVMVGGVAEGLRFWWRKRKFSETRKP